MENALMLVLQISLGITAAALVIAAILMVAKSAVRERKLYGGQPVFPPQVTENGKVEPRQINGLKVMDKVTFIEPKVGRKRGLILRFKGFRRAFVICTDGVPRRVKISRLEAV